MTLCILEKLAVLVLLGTIFIDEVMSSNHPAKGSVFKHYSPPVSILMVSEPWSAHDENKWVNPQRIEKDSTPFVFPAPSDHSKITNACQVVLKAMGERPVLVSTKTVGLINVVGYDKMAKNLAFMTAKYITDLYQRRPYYITMATFGSVGTHLPKKENFGEAASTLVGIVHINDECYSYPLRPHANDNDSSETAVHYKPISDHLEMMVEQEGVKDKDEETLNKDCHEELLLPAKFWQHR